MAIDLPPPPPSAVYFTDRTCRIEGNAFRVLETATGSVVMHITSGIRIATQGPEPQRPPPDKEPDRQVALKPKGQEPTDEDLPEAVGCASGAPVAIPAR